MPKYACSETTSPAGGRERRERAAKAPKSTRKPAQATQNRSAHQAQRCGPFAHMARKALGSLDRTSLRSTARVPPPAARAANLAKTSTKNASAAAWASSGGKPADKVAGEVSFRGFGPWSVAPSQRCALPRGFPSSTHPRAKLLRAPPNFSWRQCTLVGNPPTSYKSANSRQL